METHESRFDSLCFTSQTVLIVVMRDKKWLLAFSETTPQLAFSSCLGVSLCVGHGLVHAHAPVKEAVCYYYSSGRGNVNLT